MRIPKRAETRSRKAPLPTIHPAGEATRQQDQEPEGARRPSSAITSGIVAGVVSSLLFGVLIQPLLSWAWSRLSPLLASYYSSYSDSIYISAALGQRNWVDVLTYSAVVAANLGILTGTMVILAFPRSRPTSAFRRFVTGTSRSALVTRVIIGIAMVCGMFSALSGGFRALADLQLTTTFEQRVSILAPYLSEQQEEVLYASWAMMTTRSDYEAIIGETQILADQYNIELPRPLMR
jgi:hypothetical protein